MASRAGSQKEVATGDESASIVVSSEPQAGPHHLILSGGDTPLKKALHAAAALASVTAGGADVSPISLEGPCQSLLLSDKTTVAKSEMKQQYGSKITIISNPDSSMNVSASETASYSRKGVLESASPPKTMPTSHVSAYHQPHYAIKGLPGIPFQPYQIPGVTMLPPGAYHQIHSSVKESEVPPIFRGVPQRSGKWTREEEAYAGILIELFEKGHIAERNGCTLRSFLSRKLHCPPMRISKKYAGTGIGKLVFLSKNTFDKACGEPIGSKAYHAKMQRLSQAESAFYKKCFPHLNTIHSSFQEISNANKAFHAPIFPYTQVMTGSQGEPHMMHTGQSGGVAANMPFAPTAPNPALSYAVLQAQAPGARPTCGQQLARKPDVSRQGPANVNSAPRAPYEYTNTATPIQNTDISTTTDHPRHPEVGPNPTWRTAVSESSLVGRTGGHRPQGIPDFLSGFEKEAAEMAEPKNSDPVQFSPTYTSRSFDDFHRLLGKNLSPLLHGKRSQHQSTLPSTLVSNPERLHSQIENASTDASRQHLPSSIRELKARKTTQEQCPNNLLQKAYNEALSKTFAGEATSNAADSYSFFAQQSVFAASQHSAYTGQHSETSDGSLFLLEGQGSPQRNRVNSDAFFMSRNPSSCHGTGSAAAVSNESSDQGSVAIQTELSSDIPSDGGSQDSDGTVSESSKKRARLQSDDMGGDEFLSFRLI